MKVEVLLITLSSWEGIVEHLRWNVSESCEGMFRKDSWLSCGRGFCSLFRLRQLQFLIDTFYRWAWLLLSEWLSFLGSLFGATFTAAPLIWVKNCVDWTPKLHIYLNQGNRKPTCFAYTYEWKCSTENTICYFLFFITWISHNLNTNATDTCKLTQKIFSGSLSSMPARVS